MTPDQPDEDRARLVALHDALIAAGLADDNTVNVTIDIPARGYATVATTSWLDAGETTTVTRPLTHTLTFGEDTSAVSQESDLLEPEPQDAGLEQP